MGGSNENEVFLFCPVYFFCVKNLNFGKIFQLVLVNVLNCVYDAVSQILRKNVEKKNLFDSLDVVMLAVDEICDRGLHKIRFNFSHNQPSSNAIFL